MSATVDDEILDKAQQISKQKNYRNFSHYFEEALILLNDKNSV